jgi:ATP-dependent DNA ligase
LRASLAVHEINFDGYRVQLQASCKNVDGSSAGPFRATFIALAAIRDDLLAFHVLLESL